MFPPNFLPFFAFLLTIFLVVPTFQTGTSGSNEKNKGKEKAAEEEKEANAGRKDHRFQMLIEAADLLKDATSESHNHGQQQMDLDSPGKKRKMTGTKVPTQKKGRKGAATAKIGQGKQQQVAQVAQPSPSLAPSQMQQMAQLPSSPPLTPLRQPQQQQQQRQVKTNAPAQTAAGPTIGGIFSVEEQPSTIAATSIGADGVQQPLAATAVAAGEGESSNELPLMENNDLAQMFLPQMPNWAEYEGRRDSMQELANKFQQQTSLSTASLPNLNTPRPTNKAAQKIDEALRKELRHCCRKASAASAAAMSRKDQSAKMNEDNRPIHEQLDESILEWVLSGGGGGDGNDDEEAAAETSGGRSRGYEAEDEAEERNNSNNTRHANPSLGRSSLRGLSANEPAGVVPIMIPSPTVSRGATNAARKIQREIARRHELKTVQLMNSRLRNTQSEEDFDSFDGEYILPSPNRIVMAQSQSSLRAADRRSAPSMWLPSPSSSAPFPTTQAVGGEQQQKQQHQQQPLMDIDSPSSASLAAEATVPLTPIGGRQMDTMAPSSSSLQPTTTKSQWQSPAAQSEELVIEVLSQIIRALSTSRQQQNLLRFTAGQGPFPYALDIDVNGILKLINERKSDPKFIAEQLLSQMKEIRNVWIDEMMTQIAQEHAQFSAHIPQNDKGQRELNFLFFFIRLFWKLNMLLKWSSLEMGHPNSGMRNHLLRCAGILGGELGKEFAHSFYTNKNRAALQWTNELYRLDNAIELTNFGIWLLLFSSPNASIPPPQTAPSPIAIRPTAQKEFVAKIGRQFIEQQINDNHLTEAGTGHAAWIALKETGQGLELKSIFDPLADKVKQCSSSIAHLKNLPTKAMVMTGVMRQIRARLNMVQFGTFTVPYLVSERDNGLAIMDKCLDILHAKIESFNQQVRKELWEVDKTCRQLMEGDGSSGGTKKR